MARRASVNDLSSFQLGLEEPLIRVVITLLGTNQAFFEKVLSDDATRAAIIETLAPALYERLRKPADS